MRITVLALWLIGMFAVGLIGLMIYGLIRTIQWWER